MGPHQAKAPKLSHTSAIHKEAAPKATPSVPGTAAGSANPPGTESSETEDPSASDKKYNPNGRRDPFLSPVVQRAGGSGCSTGKKCLEIGEINLRGVVRSEAGFIAVVSNGMNKAYSNTVLGRRYQT